MFATGTLEQPRHDSVEAFGAAASVEAFGASAVPNTKALRHTVPPQKLLWKAGGVTTAPACTIKAALKVRPSAHHVVSQRSILSSCDKLSRRATSQSANQRPATSQSTNQRPATWPCEPRGSPELHGLLESVCHHRVHLRSRFLGDAISGVMI